MRLGQRDVLQGPGSLGRHLLVFVSQRNAQCQHLSPITTSGGGDPPRERTVGALH